MVIRWLGAYGKRGTLYDSLVYELERQSKYLVCATSNTLYNVRIGLLVRSRAIVRRFSSDVYSVPVNKRGGKRLEKTREEGDAQSYHNELWVKQDYSAIVVNGRISQDAEQIIREISRIYKIKIIRLKRR